MPTIQVLDQNTINQIAAGEVIERPASVVKELLENAIDAKATAVTIEIKDGGINFIRITDNGCGIEKQDIPVAFLRHSTSKIRSVEDLLSVSSLGFRGEALSSIAAVSQVELITKTPGALHGVRYEIDGGVEKKFEEIGSPEGTTFLVRNLFYNIPARRKFLKSAQTEAGYIADIVERIALSHPEVSIRFINNNQNKLHTNGSHSLKDVIYTVYGRDITTNMIAVEASFEHASIKGFIGKPIVMRGNRAFENYYVNGRYIKSNLIFKAIEEAYQPFLMQHKYPFTVLHIQVDTGLLDVNVHPTKMELRFRNGEEIYHFLFSTIRNALSHKELIPELIQPTIPETVQKPAVPVPQKAMQEKRPEAVIPVHTRFARTIFPKEVQAPVSEKVLFVREGSAYEVQSEPEKPPLPAAKELNQMPDKGTEEPKIAEDPKMEQMELFDDKLLSKASKDRHRIIGQLFDTYWLVQFQDKLFLIDQHAAHEKVLYEKTMATLKTREYTSQILNPPIILTLSMREEEIFKQYRKYFTDIGFEIEHFGGKEYALRAVPDNLFGIAQQDIFLEMLGGLSDEVKTENQELIYEKVATMSCKAAVKGNSRLSCQEAESLIDQLLELENPYHCPHGRPTIVSMSKYEIERKFKRII